MLYRNGKKIVSMMVNGKRLSILRRPNAVIWQAVRSPFGSGVWHGERLWDGSEKWKSNK